jgi:DNA-binding SARP family transcriptional activator
LGSTLSMSSPRADSRRRLRPATGVRKSAPAGQLRIRMFGSLSVDDGRRRLGVRDFGGVKPKQILEILLVARGRSVPKDRLAEHLWPSSLPRNVAGTIESYVSVLRTHLSPGTRLGHMLVVTEPEAYRLELSHADIDVDRFDALVAQAEKSATPAERRALLEEAVALAQGELLEDEPYADWVDDMRESYRRIVLRARLDAARAALADGDLASCAEHAEAAIALDRSDEEAVRTAMIAYSALGRRQDALRTFNRCRTILVDEVGIEPAAETTALAASVRAETSVDELIARHLPGFLAAQAARPAAPVALAAAGPESGTSVVGACVVGLLLALGDVAPDLRLRDLAQELRRTAALEPLLALLPPEAAVAVGGGASRARGLAAAPTHGA